MSRHYIGTPRATSILSAFLDFGEAELDLDAEDNDCSPPLDFDEAMAALEAANAAPTLDVKLQVPNADDCDSSKSTRWSDSDRTPYAQTTSCFSMCDRDEDNEDGCDSQAAERDPEKEGSEASDGEEYEEEYDSDFESESEYDSGSEDEGEQQTATGSAPASGSAAGSDSLPVARRARSSSRTGRMRSSSRTNSRANPRASSRSGVHSSTRRNFPSASELLGQPSPLSSTNSGLPPALPSAVAAKLTFHLPLPPSIKGGTAQDHESVPGRSAIGAIAAADTAHNRTSSFNSTNNDKEEQAPEEVEEEEVVDTEDVEDADA